MVGMDDDIGNRRFDGIGGLSDAELLKQKQDMQKKPAGTPAAAIDEQTKKLREQLPEIGGPGWNRVGNVHL